MKVLAKRVNVNPSGTYTHHYEKWSPGHTLAMWLATPHYEYEGWNESFIVFVLPSEYFLFPTQPKPISFFSKYPEPPKHSKARDVAVWLASNAIYGKHGRC